MENTSGRVVGLVFHSFTEEQRGQAKCRPCPHLLNLFVGFDDGAIVGNAVHRPHLSAGKLHDIKRENLSESLQPHFARD